MAILELPPRLSLSSLLRRGGRGWRGREGRRRGEGGRGREGREGGEGRKGGEGRGGAGMGYDRISKETKGDQCLTQRGWSPDPPQDEI